MISKKNKYYGQGDASISASRIFSPTEAPLNVSLKGFRPFVSDKNKNKK